MKARGLSLPLMSGLCICFWKASTEIPCKMSSSTFVICQYVSRSLRIQSHFYSVFCSNLVQVATQEHIMTQWTRVQAELATLTSPQIGSIRSISPSGEPVIGGLASSAAELRDAGPFSRAVEYFAAIADAAASKLDSSARLGALVLRDILDKTTLFGDVDTIEQFPLNHMDLGTRNILVDDQFNFIAIIDWEFAQTAPWQVNRYPMPFPLLQLNIEDILRDPGHLAHRNVLRQDVSRRLYRQKFQEAERTLEEEGRPLNGSFADTLDSPASRTYACFNSLGRLQQADSRPAP